jgi:hypothetical protein
MNKMQLNQSSLEKKWKQARDTIVQPWNEVYNDLAIKEVYKQLVDLLQQKHNYSRQKAEEEIHLNLSNYHNELQKATLKGTSDIGVISIYHRVVAIFAMFLGFLSEFWFRLTRRS